MAAPTSERPVAIVTGGNKGLGLETCRQLSGLGYKVVLTARDAVRGSSIDRFSAWVATELKRVDALVNNAAVALDGFDGDVARHTLATNFLGARDLTDAVAANFSPGANVVMVSSGLGQLSCLGPDLRRVLAAKTLTRDQLFQAMESFVADVDADRNREAGWPSSAYNVSKVGINALTRLLAREFATRGIKVNAVCPGWVRTDMGGRQAARGVEEGARGIVWAATLGGDGPSGGFFRDRQPIAW